MKSTLGIQCEDASASKELDRVHILRPKSQRASERKKPSGCWARFLEFFFWGGGGVLEDTIFCILCFVLGGAILRSSLFLKHADT